MTIEFAASNLVDEYRLEINQILLAIAKYMIEDGESPEEWVGFTFVSNESSLGDFLLAEHLEPLTQILHLQPLGLRDRLVDLAITMRQRKYAV